MILWVHQRAHVSAMTAPNWADCWSPAPYVNQQCWGAHIAFLPSLGHGHRGHDGKPLHLKGQLVKSRLPREWQFVVL